MRIWKKARTADEIRASAEGNCTIDPTDPNLVCAWDFVISKTDLDMTKTEFKDLTGRYTALLAIINDEELYEIFAVRHGIHGDSFLLG